MRIVNIVHICKVSFFLANTHNIYNSQKYNKTDKKPMLNVTMLILKFSRKNPEASFPPGIKFQLRPSKRSERIGPNLDGCA